MSIFSNNVKRYRKEIGLTQKQLADKLYVTKQAISKWENGRGYPDASILPLLANTLSISIDNLMGNNVDNKRINNKILLSSIIIIFITVLFLIFNIIESNRTKNTLRRIETKINFDLPYQGSLETADFNNWILYGNLISVSRMSYIVFSNEKEISVFEDNVKKSEYWMPKFDENLIELIPLDIFYFTQSCDYYMLCNIDLKEYNRIPSSIGDYNFIFLCYQASNNRLLFFEYKLSYNMG